MVSSEASHVRLVDLLRLLRHEGAAGGVHEGVEAAERRRGAAATRSAAPSALAGVALAPSAPRARPRRAAPPPARPPRACARARRRPRRRRGRPGRARARARGGARRPPPATRAPATFTPALRGAAYSCGRDRGDGGVRLGLRLVTEALPEHDHDHWCPRGRVDDRRVVAGAADAAGLVGDEQTLRQAGRDLLTPLLSAHDLEHQPAGRRAGAAVLGDHRQQLGDVARGTLLSSAWSTANESS